MSRTITAFGETLTLREWAQRTGLSTRTLAERMEHTGWSGETIVTAPKCTRMRVHTRPGEARLRERLIDPATPWEEDDRCWYVTECHPDGLTLDQIGELIGVTRERTRQIQNIAFDKLKEDPESFQVLIRLLRESRERESREDEGRQRTAWERTRYEVHAAPPARAEDESEDEVRAKQVTTVDGHTMTRTEHAERLGVTRNAIDNRIKNGWTEEEACQHARGERPARLGKRRHGGGKPSKATHAAGGQVLTGTTRKKTRRRKKPPGEPANLGEPDEGELRYPLALRHDRERIEHKFPLRPDFVVSVELPADLTDAEAERMAGWLRALAFRGVPET